MRFKAEQSAEFLSAFRETLLPDAHQYSTIVGHHRHAHLDDGALKTFVAHLARSTRHQRRDVTFDDRTAVATGTGQVDLMWGPHPV